MSNASKKFYVIAFDGTPYTFLKKKIEAGKLPNLASLVQKSDTVFKPITSVVPPVSSSAWASFMTGKQPDEHGILSFTERDPATMQWSTPNAANLKRKTLWQHLSAFGKRVFVMNVPVTYPPQELNGVSICGFLGDDILKGTWPAAEGTFLQNNGYKIDADTEIAKMDLDAFLDELVQVYEKRVEMMWHYFEQEPWDFFMLHIMETDRLHHFTWELMEQGDPHINLFYDSFYARLDALVGNVLDKLPTDTGLMLLSDHGFTTLKKEVYMNRWLWQQDLLKFTKPVPHNLNDIHPLSVAYSLYPGRIFINLKGREKNGFVEPGMMYEQMRNLVREKLMGLIDPQTGQKIIREVLNGEDVYREKTIIQENENKADRYRADLFAIAEEGYDLKGILWNRELLHKGVFNGMHSYHNAFMVVHNAQCAVYEDCIIHVANIILRAMGLPNLS